jgi:PAS domain S-box-containing protein
MMMSDTSDASPADKLQALRDRVAELERAQSERKRAEQALRSSEQRFRRVLESSRDAIYELNLQTGTYDFVSSGVMLILGYTPEEIIGGGLELIISLTHPDDLEGLREHIEHLLSHTAEEDINPTIEYRLKSREHGYRWISDARSVVFDDNHVPIAIVGNVRDITQQKQTGEALRQSEARLRSLTENAPDFIVQVDRQGTLLFLNRTVTGNLDQALGTSVYDWVPGQYHAAVRDTLERAFVTRQPQQLETAAADLQGNRLWYACHVGPVVIDHQCDSVVIIARDITEHKRAEDALRESELRFRAIFNQTYGFVGILSPDGTLIDVNDAPLRISGFTREATVGHLFWDCPWWEQFPEEQRQLQADFAEAAAGRVVKGECNYGTADGTQRVADRTLAPVLDADGCVRWIIAEGHDITDRKRAEQRLIAEERLTRKLLDLQERERQLLAYEIHDGFVQYVVGAHMWALALGEELKSHDSPFQDHAETIRALLDKAIAEGRRMIGELRPLIIDEQGIVAAIEYLIAEEGGKGEFELQFVRQGELDPLPPLLKGTVFRIVQEAVSNSKRHSQSNKADIRLTRADGRLLLEVSDQGVGFEPASVPDDRFGLRGIQERARLFGGNAKITSSPGRGTRIRVELPIVE